MIRTVHTFPWLMIAGLTFAAPASAQIDDFDNGWHFEVAPYLWAISLDGDAAIMGGPGFDVDAPFSDTLSDADTLIGLMGHFELGKGKWSVFFTPAYSKVGYDDIITGYGSTDVEVETAWYEFGGAWRFHDDAIDGDEARRWTVDAIAGGRVTSLGIDISPDAGPGADDDKTWIEPFIGLRTGVDLSPRFTLRFRGDIGGFGAGSDFAWQAVGLIGWKFVMFDIDSTLFAGYRALGQDYDSGGFAWDVVAHGPVFGLAMRF